MAKRNNLLDSGKNKQAPVSNEILSEMKETAPTVSAPVSDIENLMAGYKEQAIVDNESFSSFEAEKPGKKRGRPAKQSEPINIDQNAVMSGAILLLLVDFAIPNVISFINNRFNKKGKKIAASSLQMSKEQIKELTPLADQVAKEMFVKSNPLAMLIISMLGIYGVNFMMVKSE